jgi:lipoate---protein ligase
VLRALACVGCKACYHPFMTQKPTHDFPLWGHDDDLISTVQADGQMHHRVVAWDSVEIVIGRGGKAELELDMAAIQAEGVPVSRRRGGGCAVVLDQGNVIVSAVAPRPGIGEVTQAFRDFTAWMIAGLAAVGLTGVTSDGVSDLVLDNRKIGGSCIYRTRGLVYYSTTLLVSPDLDAIERYLPHPPREPDYRAGRCHREFLGILQSPELRSAAQLAEALQEGLAPILK